MSKKEDFINHIAYKNSQVVNALNQEMSKNAQEIYQVVKEKEYKGIVVYFLAVGFEPMQRPQHILRELAQKGYLCFFCDIPDEHQVCIRKYCENLYIVNREEELISALRDEENILAYITWGMQYEMVKYLKNPRIWFDVLDEPSFLANYQFLKNNYKKMQDEAQLFTYTSDRLKKYVLKDKIGIYLPNGVTLEDFSNPSCLNEELKKRKENGPLIGYYGAIENWFDMQLIKELTKQIPNANIVLIGHVNITIPEELKSKIFLTGKIEYSLLKEYASLFDVGMIPFKKNKITHAVSPVKFFEYLALGIPCVSTDIAEMRKYKEIEGVYIAKNKKEFVQSVQKAIETSTNKEVLMKEASKHTWKKRVETIINYI